MSSESPQSGKRPPARKSMEAILTDLLAALSRARDMIDVNVACGVASQELAGESE